jgi:predicted nucleic acid-binding protein
VLDSFAILSLLEGEAGADGVAGLLASPGNEIYMSSMNVGEVYYVMMRRRGKDAANLVEAAIYDHPRLQVVEADRARIRDAAEIKSLGKLSLADSFAAALALKLDATLVTGDPEFARLEAEGLSLFWLPR